MKRRIIVIFMALFILVSFVAFIVLVSADKEIIVSECNKVKNGNIRVYDDKVIITKDLYKVHTFFKRMESMYPTITESSIVLYSTNISEICVGDIVIYNITETCTEEEIKKTFKSPEGVELVLHRIVEEGIDENGVYYITKGDGNKINDPCKVHADNINAIVVGVFY